MQDADSINQYFTEQIVGTAQTLAMGPSVGVRTQPHRGVIIEGAGRALQMSLLAVRSSWAGDPVDVVVGQPLSLPGLARWRVRLLLLAWLAWSAALVGACAWWWTR